MTKQEFWERIWIPVTRRKPPDTDETILLWNHGFSEAFTQKAYIALSDLNASERGEYVTYDRLFSKWCHIGKPKGK